MPTNWKDLTDKMQDHINNLTLMSTKPELVEINQLYDIANDLDNILSELKIILEDYEDETK